MRALSSVIGIGAAFLLVGCSQETAPTSPTSAASTPSASSAPSAKRAGLQASVLSEGVTDVTLANAGWACIEPGNGLVLCAPPGLGLPPIPPAADGQPTYDIMAF